MAAGTEPGYGRAAGWQDALRAGRAIMVAEAAHSDAHLLSNPVAAAKLSQQVRIRFAEADGIGPEQMHQARVYQQRWRAAGSRLVLAAPAPGHRPG